VNPCPTARIYIDSVQQQQQQQCAKEHIMDVREKNNRMPEEIKQ
jgi:hypothetical protein